MPLTHDLPAAWTRTDVAEGLGLGTLIAETCGFTLEANETVAGARDRFSCRFTVHTDLAWVTRNARVETLSPEGAHVVELSGSGGRWTVNGNHAPELDGCVDVEVAATPLTNTLPIRRLGLAPGEFRDIAVARVEVPSLWVCRVAQRYTRLHSSTGPQRYECRGNRFGTHEITVDREGMVLDYEGLARRLR